MDRRWDIGSIQDFIHKQGAKTPVDLSGSLHFSLRDIQRKLRQIEHGSLNSLSPFVERVERDRAGRYMAFIRIVPGSVDHASLQRDRSMNAEPGPGMRAIGSAVGFSLDDATSFLGTV